MKKSERDSSCRLRVSFRFLPSCIGQISPGDESEKSLPRHLLSESQVPSAISHACALPQGSSATCVCPRYKRALRLTLLSPKRVPDSWASDLWHHGTFGHSCLFVTMPYFADVIEFNSLLPQKESESEISLKSYHSNRSISKIKKPGGTVDEDKIKLSNICKIISANDRGSLNSCWSFSLSNIPKLTPRGVHLHHVNRETAVSRQRGWHVLVSYIFALPITKLNPKGRSGQVYIDHVPAAGRYGFFYLVTAPFLLQRDVPLQVVFCGQSSRYLEHIMKHERLIREVDKELLKKNQIIVIHTVTWFQQLYISA